MCIDCNLIILFLRFVGNLIKSSMFKFKYNTATLASVDNDVAIISIRKLTHSSAISLLALTLARSLSKCRMLAWRFSRTSTVAYSTLTARAILLKTGHCIAVSTHLSLSAIAPTLRFTMRLMEAMPHSMSPIPRSLTGRRRFVSMDWYIIMPKRVFMSISTMFSLH